MGVRVHPAGNDEPGLRGDLFLAAAESRLDRPDHASRDADVRGPNAVGIHHGPAAHHRFEVSHRKRAILRDGTARTAWWRPR